MRAFIFVLLALLQTITVCVAACDDLNSGLAMLSKDVSARITSPATVTVGASLPIEVEWTFQSLHNQGSQPFYFIVSTKKPIRFEGLGFLALSKDAAGPTQVQCRYITQCLAARVKLQLNRS
jgi:hypothetical protein